MRYRDIIDFEEETEEERDQRYAFQYGEDAEEEADDAETMLLRAKAAKLHAETQAILRKAKAEHDDLILQKAQELLDDRFVLPVEAKLG
jgi:hypothetical protein